MDGKRNCQGGCRVGQINDNVLSDGIGNPIENKMSRIFECSELVLIDLEG